MVDGENSGEVFIVFEDGVLGSTLNILDINHNTDNEYMLYILSYFKEMFKQRKKGIAIPHLDKYLFNNVLIPLPPLAEQERIVKKLDELMIICDKLKDSI